MRGRAIGGGGIRTHESLRSNGFQDRRFQPLSHPSAGIARSQSAKATSTGSRLKRNRPVLRCAASHFAALLNASTAQLVLSDTYRRNVGDLSVLSRSLEQRVAIALVDHSSAPTLSSYRPVFAFNPSPLLMERLRRRYALRPVGVDFPVYEVTLAVFLTPSMR